MRRQGLAAIAAVLLLATLSVCWPVTGNGFLDYDDPVYLTRNFQVRRGLTLEGARWAFTSFHGGNWHPLTWLSHQLDVQFFGLEAGRHHLVSLLLHAVAVVCLFLVLAAMTGAAWRSALVSLLFALHPLHVESVAWAAERKDVLSGLFWVIAMWAYLRYLKRPRPAGLLAVAAACALGLMAKPMGVTLPLVLLLLDFWPLGRLREGPAWRRRLGKLLGEKAPLFALSGISAGVTLAAQRGAIHSLESLPLWRRLIHVPVAYALYLGKTVLPSGLAFFYPLPREVDPARAAGAVALFGALCLAAVAMARRRPYFAVGWFWFAGTLAPVIGLVQVGGQAMADRYTYLPLIGIFMAVAWGMAEWATTGRGAAAVALVLLLALPAMTFQTRRQIAYWRDNPSLLRHALAVTEGNYVAHDNLGLYLARLGRTDEAMAHYREGLRIKPDDAKLHNNLGVALAERGRRDEALREWLTSIRLKPSNPEAHNNLGIALAWMGREAEAEAEFRTALRHAPDYAEAHSNLGKLLARQGRMAEAKAHLGQADLFGGPLAAPGR